jgi:hypothetical protein
MVGRTILYQSRSCALLATFPVRLVAPDVPHCLSGCICDPAIGAVIRDAFLAAVLVKLWQERSD